MILLSNGETDYNETQEKTASLIWVFTNYYPMEIFHAEPVHSFFCYQNPFILETTIFSSIELKNTTLKFTIYPDRKSWKSEEFRATNHCKEKSVDQRSLFLQDYAERGSNGNRENGCGIK